MVKTKIYRVASDAQGIVKATEIGRVNPQIGSNEFVGHELKQMRAAFGKGFESFFGGGFYPELAQ